MKVKMEGENVQSPLRSVGSPKRCLNRGGDPRLLVGDCTCTIPSQKCWITPLIWTALGDPTLLRGLYMYSAPQKFGFGGFSSNTIIISG